MAKRAESDGARATDADVQQLVRHGDAEAFALVRRHLPSLRAFVTFHLPVRHLADEDAHETFAFACRYYHKFDLRRPLRPWLRGIAWNLVRAEPERFAREKVNRSRLEHL